ncbi:MAG: ABC transporter permease [Chloroflexaceae bacterium]|nr:ABC transporter permease [Chloroflexaceae bacterium]
MNRLLITLKLDIMLQVRNQLYVITAGVALLLVALLRQLFAANTIALVIPALLLFGMAIYLYFAAGMFLLERGQRTLSAVIITPLRLTEYVTARVVSLSLLALLETLLIVLLSYGWQLAWLPLLAGTLAMASIFVLAGLLMVVRYDSITTFLMPSMLFVILLQLPWIDYAGIWSNPIFYAFPTQPAFLLMQAGFASLSTGQLLYASIGSLVWIGLFAWWSYRAFTHYVIQQGG